MWWGHAGVESTERSRVNFNTNFCSAGASGRGAESIRPVRGQSLSEINWEWLRGENYKHMEANMHNEHAATRITLFSCPHLYSAPGHKSLAVILYVSRERNTRLKCYSNRWHEETHSTCRKLNLGLSPAQVVQITSMLKVFFVDWGDSNVQDSLKADKILKRWWESTFKWRLCNFCWTAATMATTQWISLDV